jgi:hypothetical protein
VVLPEPGLEDRLVGQPGEAVEVLAPAERAALLGEELRVDGVEDRLVVGERPVEVEKERARARTMPAPSREGSGG